MTAKKKMIIITSVGITIGILEALIYYNLGQNAKNNKFRFTIPKGNELYKTLTVIAITSVVTAGVSQIVEQMLDRKIQTARMSPST